MKRLVLAAMIAAVGAPAYAQQVHFERAFEILANGKVISAAPVSDGQSAVTHEVFVLFEGRVYLCVLTGGTQTGTEPWPACFGRS